MLVIWTLGANKTADSEPIYRTFGPETLNQSVFHERITLSLLLVASGVVVAGGIALFLSRETAGWIRILQRIGMAMIALAGDSVAPCGSSFPPPARKMEKRIPGNRPRPSIISDWNAAEVAAGSGYRRRVQIPRRHRGGPGSGSSLARQGEPSIVYVKSVSVIGIESEQTETLITVPWNSTACRMPRGPPHHQHLADGLRAIGRSMDFGKDHAAARSARTLPRITTLLKSAPLFASPFRQQRHDPSDQIAMA